MVNHLADVSVAGTGNSRYNVPLHRSYAGTVLKTIKLYHGSHNTYIVFSQFKLYFSVQV